MKPPDFTRFTQDKEIKKKFCDNLVSILWLNGFNSLNIYSLRTLRSLRFSLLRFISVFIFLCGFVLSSCAKAPSLTKTIVIWHWMTDRQAAFDELAKRYKQEKGIEVRFDIYAPSDVYTQKVRAAAQTKTLPDIFGILGESRDFASFVRSGYLENLTPYMEENDGEWRRLFFDKAIQMNEFKPGNSFNAEPGIYGVPLDITNIQMLYNKRLFKKAGLNPDTPPMTWEEFIAAGKKLKAAKIQGLVSGWGEIWLIECLASNYAWNIMGRDKIIETIKGKVPYTDRDWLKVFNLFKELSDEGLLADGIVTMVNKRAEQIFANEEAGFSFNGSWCINVYYGMNPSLEYGAMIPPKLSDKYPMVIWGGAGSNLMVNRQSLLKKEAIEFLKWLTQKEQQIFLSNQTKNLPSNREAVSAIPSTLSEFANDMDNAVHPNLLPVMEFSTVAETFGKGIQSIIIGEKTPLEVAREVQAVKERELAKKR